MVRATSVECSDESGTVRFYRPISSCVGIFMNTVVVTGRYDFKITA